MSYCTQCAALLSERDALRSELEDALADASHDKQQIKENTEMITALRAEVERLRIENIQMQFALGYPMPADLERHILPRNPYRCGVCVARAQSVRDGREALRERVAKLYIDKWCVFDYQLADAAIDLVMEEAAEVAEGMWWQGHGHLATDPYAAAKQASDEIAAALRAYIKEEGK